MAREDVTSVSIRIATVLRSVDRLCIMHMTKVQDYEYVIQAIVDKVKETTLTNGDLLFDEIRTSYIKEQGTINGNYIHVLIDVIDISIKKVEAEKVTNAYNVIASMENLDTVNPENIAYNYHAAIFLEPVLNEIL